jgi:hypothetical protein
MTITTTETTTIVTSVADTFLATVPRRIMATGTRAIGTTKETGVPIATMTITRKPRTSTTTANGSDTRSGATTIASASSIRGSMATSTAASAVDIDGAWKVAIPGVSGFAASTSASLRLTLPTVMTGIGTATMS